MAKNMMNYFVKDDDVGSGKFFETCVIRMSYDYIVDYVVDIKEWMYTPQLPFTILFPSCLARTACGNER